MKVFTAFSGYDSQCMALDRLGIDYELIAWSEIDKYAIQAHNAVYPQYADRNYGDICKIDWENVPDFDLFTYSFPCQDISNAGLQRGLKEGSGTRSGLLWECRKAIDIKRPKYLLMENVKALTSEKFLPYLQKWLFFLESMGYSNFTKVLNSKDYGVPQNRERVFVVSIFGDERYYFPKAFKLEKRLKDVLENNVDESYYLSNKMTEDLTLQHKETDVGIIYEGDVNKGGDIANCLTIVQKDSLVLELKIIQVGNLVDGGKFNNPQRGRIYDTRGISPVIDTMQGGNLEPKILEPTNKSDSVLGISVHPNGRKMEFKGESSVKGICPALRATDYKCPHTVWLSNKQVEYKGEKHDAGVAQNFRIRKLTPRECFRLMGVSEENIDKIQNAGISKTQQYKMAGNSIVVDVLYYIFKKLFIDKKANKGDEQILF